MIKDYIFPTSSYRTSLGKHFRLNKDFDQVSGRGIFHHFKFLFDFFEKIFQMMAKFSYMTSYSTHLGEHFLPNKDFPKLPGKRIILHSCHFNFFFRFMAKVGKNDNFF